MKKVTLVALASIAVLPQQPTFKARVDAVRVDALVTDGRQPITGLGAADFEVRDDGVLQRIDRVGAEDVPLEIVVALDTSTSVAGRPLEELKRAAKATLGILRPGLDRAAVLPFSHQVSFPAALTADRALLADSIDALQSAGGTSVLDAVAIGLMLRRTPGTRRLLLVYTDALDTFSWLEPDEVLAIAQRADTVIYFVGTRPDPRGYASQLPDATGGAYLNAGNITHVRDVFSKVLSEFRNRYLLTYYPEGVGRGGWHTVEVKLKGRKGQVQARRGYQAD